MKVYIGADHNGFAYKAQLTQALQQAGYTVVDKGNHVHDPADDFPRFAGEVVTALHTDPDGRGILLCGSGQGMCMAANRHKGIRASLCWSLDQAHASRNDDDSNVLCLSARYVPYEETEQIVLAWLMTPFDPAERFSRRIAELDA